VEAGGGDVARVRGVRGWVVGDRNPRERLRWQAELTGAGGVRSCREAARSLPGTDPFDRQLTVGMGWFVELDRQAGGAEGYVAEMVLFPEGENGPVADITMVAGGQPDPLFQNALSRHTNRMTYEDRAPDAAALAAMAPEASEIITETARVDALRVLTWEAMHIEMTTHRTHMESMHLTRLGKREINANPDGIAVRGAMQEALILVGMITIEGQSDPKSAEFAQTVNFIRAAQDATPAYVTVKTAGSTRLDQIKAGRRWLRLHLAATSQGVAMQPLSQALQEYAEQAALYAKVHEMRAAPGETVQMLGRIGYAADVGPSPRWPLETRIVTS